MSLPNGQSRRQGMQRPSLLLVFLGAALPAWAQQEPVQAPARIIINVTGSNIPRTDLETALPVQRITREDIERSDVRGIAQ